MNNVKSGELGSVDRISKLILFQVRVKISKEESVFFRNKMFLFLFFYFALKLVLIQVRAKDLREFSKEEVFFL